SFALSVCWAVAALSAVSSAGLAGEHAASPASNTAARILSIAPSVTAAPAPPASGRAATLLILLMESLRRLGLFMSAMGMTTATSSHSDTHDQPDTAVLTEYRNNENGDVLRRALPSEGLVHQWSPAAGPEGFVWSDTKTNGSVTRTSRPILPAL